MVDKMGEGVLIDDRMGEGVLIGCVMVWYGMLKSSPLTLASLMLSIRVFTWVNDR